MIPPSLEPDSVQRRFGTDQASYLDRIILRNNKIPKASIFVHSYDFAIRRLTRRLDWRRRFPLVGLFTASLIHDLFEPWKSQFGGGRIDIMRQF